MPQPNLAREARSPWMGVLIGVATGTAVGVVGFLLATIPATRSLGAVLFFLVPVSAGIGIYQAMGDRGSFTAAALLSTVLSLIILIAARREGPLCAAMAFPIIFISLGFGIGLGYLVRRLFGASTATTATTLALLPVLITGAHHLELKTVNQPRTLAITTTVFVPVSPEQAWAHIQSVDSISGRKPFLMHMGLPVPQRCVMRGTAVGSKRTCYFDQGFIEETILDWDPPHRMKLTIDRTNLPGRHWLGFEQAEYTLHPSADGTTITRVTTITSGLSPSWYWEPLERWGVKSEHEYLFRDLAAKLTPFADHATRP